MLSYDWSGNGMGGAGVSSNILHPFPLACPPPSSFPSPPPQRSPQRPARHDMPPGKYLLPVLLADRGSPCRPLALFLLLSFSQLPPPTHCAPAYSLLALPLLTSPPITLAIRSPISHILRARNMRLRGIENSTEFHGRLLRHSCYAIQYKKKEKKM